MGGIVSAISTVISGVGLLQSIKSSKKEGKAAQNAAQAQQAEIAKEKALALEERKTLINAQREQSGVGVKGYSTRLTSTTGIRGTINKETLG